MIFLYDNEIKNLKRDISHRTKTRVLSNQE